MVLDKIRASFEESVLDCDTAQIKSTVSMGKMEIKPKEYFKDHFLDEYINIADQKLYITKNSGRKRVEVC